MVGNSMTLKFSANHFAYASLVCSLSFWLGLILSYVPGAPRLNFSGVWWLAIMGVGVALAIVAAVLNFGKNYGFWLSFWLSGRFSS